MKQFQQRFSQSYRTRKCKIYF